MQQLIDRITDLSNVVERIERQVRELASVREAKQAQLDHS